MQVTAFGLAILDTLSGEPLFSLAEPGEADIQLTITSPNGESVDFVENKWDLDVPDGFSHVFYPAGFGDYEYYVDISFPGKDISFAVEAFVIEEIVIDDSPWVLTVTVACVIGAVLIGIALLYYRKQKKDKFVHRARAVEIDYTRYHFCGKLAVRTVLVEGGNRDVQPFDFVLERIRPERKVSLKDIYESSGIPFQHKALENITFLVGTDSSVIVKNNSDAEVRVASKDYGKGQKVEVYFNDKIYIILDKDIDEIEIMFRQVKPRAEKIIAMPEQMVINSSRGSRY